MKKFYFMSGLPRSGSTLISSILNQNPDIYSSSNSPVCSLMYSVEASILQSEQYNAYPKEKVVSPTTLGILENYYCDTDKSHIVDKSRDWAINVNLDGLLRNLPYKPKIIMTVRDIPDILASFITLVHKNPTSKSVIDLEIESGNEYNLYRPMDDIRCDNLMRPKGLVDNSLFGIANAILKENKQYFHFVEYEDLVNSPEDEINKIYDFLEIKKYVHNFNNIVNNIKENDDIYGLKGMHDVRPTISKRKIKTNEILSPYILNKYSNLEFWRNNGKSL